MRMGVSCVDASYEPLSLSHGRDGTTKERHGDKIRRHLQVKDGGEETRNS